VQGAAGGHDMQLHQLPLKEEETRNVGDQPDEHHGQREGRPLEKAAETHGF
jgi:hypothetical protein